jgi:GNAT superfamily N-acetyltransferase
LAIIATAPAQQGKGYGGALLRAINRVADSEGLPAYLETGENNRSLYEHFGYEVVGRTQLDGGHRSDEEGEWPPCPLLGMLRQPVKSASASSLVETTPST